MKLNQFEKKLVSHPLRLWIQHHVEAPLLMSLFDSGPGVIEDALEIGCGYGEGIALIKSCFGASRVTAIDLDPEHVTAVADRYVNDPTITLACGDATCLAFSDNSFDLVCNFAVFHHIPDWQRAVDEVFRVLRPGGAFVLEDLYRSAICNPVSKRLFEHPQENRFDHRDMLAQLKRTGFEVLRDNNLLNLSGMILVRKPLSS